MRYLSVCSGIEAASVAWGPLGWSPVAFAEIEKFPSALLAHHYPSVPNWGDMTKFMEWPDAKIDVLVGGTPCQSFSVAGLRSGMADPRGNLALVYLAIADRYRPEWLVWENVPGVRSVNGGRDFGSFLGALGKLRYGWAYRSLDAQYFGLAQRRERVFVVGHRGDWRRAAAVLFDGESLSGNPAPRREAGQRIANSPTVGANQCSGRESDTTELAHTLLARTNSSLRADAETYVSMTLTAHAGRIDAESKTFITRPSGGGGAAQITSAANYSNPEPNDPSHPLARSAHMQTIAFGWQNASGQGLSDDPHTTPTLDKSKPPAVATFDPVNVTSKANRTRVEYGPPANTLHPADPSIIGPAVRRLTPRECERLQGFPDDYTLVPYRKKPAADGPRYKALGNSMAVPVMRWIGERLENASRLRD